MNLYRIRSGARWAAAAVCAGLVLASAPGLYGQSSSVPGQRSLRRFTFGIRASVFGLNQFRTGQVNKSTTSPVADYTYTTASKTQRLGGGVTAELALTRRISIGADLLYHYIGYQLDTTIVTGTDNPDTLVDERQTTTSTELTRARYYDLPMVVRIAVVNKRAADFRFYFLFGGVLRRTKDVKTSLETTLPDLSKTYSYVPKTLENRTTSGLVGGMGVRIVDDFKIRVSPEVRYTRWRNNNFGGLPSAPRRDQIEALVGITF